MVNFWHSKPINNGISGFTLVELIIVVAVIGILSSIAYPSYLGYREKAIRADAMAELQQVAGRIEAQKINYKRYDKIPLTAIFSTTLEADGSIKYPTSDKAYYQISVAPIDTTKTPVTLNGERWKLSATPIATERMANDGVMTLDYTGVRCRADKCGKSDEWRK